MTNILNNYYEILKVLRDNDINSEIFLDSKKNLGKQLTYANKKKCPSCCHMWGKRI